jgi:hypothetical protein
MFTSRLYRATENRLGKFKKIANSLPRGSLFYGQHSLRFLLISVISTLICITLVLNTA